MEAVVSDQVRAFLLRGGNNVAAVGDSKGVERPRKGGFCAVWCEPDPRCGTNVRGAILKRYLEACFGAWENPCLSNRV